MPTHKAHASHNVLNLLNH
ncbi:hypothetical protein DSL72_008552 [Monilinia vaccinii-corymbosi]|uniref:Uncharacterized protein n=1 Tax=Monilinia vaccinii-corymbosi TaxID=61207 RepID=A0A8A3PRP8_9HELO|nr:hypothetical protein DSL72_008552 [Monilinia vaccinii-corymbosi]